MNKTYETSFKVMPTDANYMYPMIFGGAFFSRMDLAAASCVKRLLYSSFCDSAVTHKFEGTFHDAAQVGDLIFLKAEVVELRKKAIVVHVSAEGERDSESRVKLADAKFVFVSKVGDGFCHHGLEL